MNVEVRFFAYFREQLGRSRVQLEMPDSSTVEAVWRRCTQDNQQLAGLWSAVLVAVNGEYAEHDAAVNDGDEVAFLPPVSGGALRCRVVDRPIAIAVLEDEVAGARHGAIVTFVGVVRMTSPTGKTVCRIEYEAFEDMAAREMEKIAREIDDRWPGCAVAMEHRVGSLAIGDASIAIAIATPHRAEAFEACRYAIDRVKETVPIWKKELFEDGSEWVGMGA